MKQTEYLDRVKGVIPTDFYLRLLSQVSLPLQAGQPLQEVSWSGYAATKIEVDQINNLQQSTLTLVDGYADFYQNQEAKGLPANGVAITFDTPDGNRYVCSIRAYDPPLIITYGKCRVRIILTVQGFVGIQ